MAIVERHEPLAGCLVDMTVNVERLRGAEAGRAASPGRSVGSEPSGTNW
jgi:hypothetical protein